MDDYWVNGRVIFLSVPLTASLEQQARFYLGSKKLVVSHKRLHTLFLFLVLMVRSWHKLIKKSNNQNEFVSGAVIMAPGLVSIIYTFMNQIIPSARKLSLIFPPEIKVAVEGNIWVIDQA